MQNGATDKLCNSALSNRSTTSTHKVRGAVGTGYSIILQICQIQQHLFRTQPVALLMFAGTVVKGTWRPGSQRICATISWSAKEAQQRTQQGWSITIASRSGRDLDILHGSELDLSLTVATPSMGMVALCSCFDVFRCYVRM